MKGAARAWVWGGEKTGVHAPLTQGGHSAAPGPCKHAFMVLPAHHQGLVPRKVGQAGWREALLCHICDGGLLIVLGHVPHVDEHVVEELVGTAAQGAAQGQRQRESVGW